MRKNNLSTLLLLAVLLTAFATPRVFAEPPVWFPVYDGIDVTSWTERDEPLRKIYAARINLTVPGVAIKTSAPNENFAPEERETWRETTPQFLLSAGVKIAVNANFYRPFNAETIKSAGDSNLLGLAVSDGFVVSQPEKGYPSFLVDKNGVVDIRVVAEDEPLDDVMQAVSGNRIVLKDGEIVSDSDKSVHPRTAIGYSKDKRFLYLLTIDGRQKDYSIGATYEDVAKAIQRCGASDALNLDGGGSTTMAILDEDGEPLTLNRPINSTFDRLRFNGNSIGVTAPGTIKLPLVDGRILEKKTPEGNASVKYVPARER